MMRRQNHAANLAPAFMAKACLFFIHKSLLRRAQQLIQPDASIAFFSCSFLALVLNASRSARVNSGVRRLPLEEHMRNIHHIIALCCALLFVSTIQAQTSNAQAVANPILRQELLQRVEQDQAIRNELIKKGMEHLDQSILARMQAIDTSNTERMRTIVRQYGWPGPGLVGRDGTEAAFLLVQHANLAFQKEMLPLIEKAYKRGELSGQSYALLLDRVLVGEGKRQVYGTQAKLKGKEFVPDPIEDEANVDKRRAEVGLPPLSEYLQVLKQMYFPQESGNP